MKKAKGNYWAIMNTATDKRLSIEFMNKESRFSVYIYWGLVRSLVRFEGLYCIVPVVFGAVVTEIVDLKGNRDEKGEEQRWRLGCLRNGHIRFLGSNKIETHFNTFASQAIVTNIKITLETVDSGFTETI